MRSVRTCCGSLLAGALLVCAAAQIEGAPRAAGQEAFKLDSASARWTIVSGTGASYKELLVPNDDSLFKLYFEYDRTDAAKVIVAVTPSHRLLRSVAAGQDWAYHEQYTTGTVRLRSSPSGEPFTPAIEGYIYRIQVCQDSTHSKMKGVKIWGKRIQADASLVLTNESVYQKSDCRFWVAGAACSNDKIASGIRAHYTGEGTYGFTGFSLRCETVQPNTGGAAGFRFPLFRIPSSASSSSTYPPLTGGRPAPSWLHQ